MPELDYVIMDALDRYVAAARRTTRKEIDASCCQTSRDWRNLQEAEDKEAAARDELEKILQGCRAALPTSLGATP